MNENKFLKIFCLLAFLAFATVSCWATAESLHLLLSTWPIIMCWIVTNPFGVLVLCSMPTYTHTFLYYNAILDYIWNDNSYCSKNRLNDIEYRTI